MTVVVVAHRRAPTEWHDAEPIEPLTHVRKLAVYPGTSQSGTTPFLPSVFQRAHDLVIFEGRNE